MDPRTLLLGSKLHAAITAGLVVVASVGGAFALGAIGAPSVVAVENRFGPVDPETTVIETDLVVSNPNPIGVQLGGTTVSYDVSMNNISIANGTKEGLGLQPGNTTLNFSTTMFNEKIPAWWVTHIRNDERTTVDVDARARTSLLGGRVFPFHQTKQVQTDIIGQFNSNETRAVNAGTAAPTSNPVLYINATRADWGRVTAERTPIPMEFMVYNPHLQPYTVAEVGGTITMNGIEVGSVSTDRTYLIPGGASRTLAVRTTIKNPALDEWWVSHLRNGQVTSLRIDFYLKLEGIEARIPVDQLTYEKRIETDIFGTKNATEPPDMTPTATDSPSTPSGEPTPTPTPDSTPTDTSDGVLGAFELRRAG